MVRRGTKDELLFALEILHRMHFEDPAMTDRVNALAYRAYQALPCFEPGMPLLAHLHYAWAPDERAQPRHAPQASALA
ncbi:MAG: hypothetical protein JNK11_13090 [Alphaproteobacteria bacterium]|nr:hypothetical protein [Alphaproteobacteria bacterium]